MSAATVDCEDAFELTTKRLLLRPPAPPDAAALTRLADNPNIALQTARMPFPYRLSDAEAWIARLRTDGGSAETSFVALLKGSSEPIGAVGFGVLDAEAELGYWIGEPFWGRGYATEAAQAVIDHAFSSTDLPRLGARARVGNLASRRVLEKCAFQYRGPGMLYAAARKGPVPTEDFVLERFVWESLKRWGVPA